MDISGVASISNRTQHNRAKSSWSGRFLAECPIGELSEQEFRDRYYILESIFIRLSDGNNSSTHELPNNMIYFTKEQFVAGLRLLIPSLVKQFLHFSRIFPIFIHPNVIWILMGWSVLGTLY